MDRRAGWSLSTLTQSTGSGYAVFWTPSKHIQATEDVSHLTGTLHLPRPANAVRRQADRSGNRNRQPGLDLLTPRLRLVQEIGKPACPFFSSKGS